MTTSMHLDPDALDVVRKVITDIAPAIPVFLYGSRAHGRGVRPFSDLDLCLKGSSATPTDIVDTLRAAFSASDLPMLVDLVDWHQLTPGFQTVIAPDLILIAGEAPKTRAGSTGRSQEGASGH